MRIAVTGGTGLIGPALCKTLVGQGEEVVVISRDPARARLKLPDGVEAVSWPDGAKEPDSRGEALQGVDAIVNLAGEPIAQRWTRNVKSRLRESRLNSLQRLFELVERSASRPTVLVSASAIGYYGPRGDEALTE